MTEVYLQFYQSTHPVFNTLNKLLQAEEPLLDRLHEVQQHFMTKLTSKFIEPQVVQNHLKSKNSFSTLDLSQCNQKADRELSVGLLTHSIIEYLLDKGDVSQYEVDRFYDGARAFFTKAFEYCSTWLRLDDDFLKYCTFVDVRNRANNPFSFVKKILPYFKVHHSLINDANSLGELHDEYIEFQAMPDTGIPENIWKDAEIGKNVSQQSKRKPDIRMDIIWGYLRQRFPALASVAHAVLCIPQRFPTLASVALAVLCIPQRFPALASVALTVLCIPQRFPTLASVALTVLCIPQRFPTLASVALTVLCIPQRFPTLASVALTVLCIPQRFPTLASVALTVLCIPQRFPTLASVALTVLCIPQRFPTLASVALTVLCIPQRFPTLASVALTVLCIPQRFPTLASVALTVL